jgi:hypothetical protein
MPLAAGVYPPGPCSGCYRTHSSCTLAVRTPVQVVVSASRLRLSPRSTSRKPSQANGHSHFRWCRTLSLSAFSSLRLVALTTRTLNCGVYMPMSICMLCPPPCVQRGPPLQRGGRRGREGGAGPHAGRGEGHRGGDGRWPAGPGARLHAHQRPVHSCRTPPVRGEDGMARV